MWILTFIKIFSYIHSYKVFVDDIALRNILIIDKQLELALWSVYLITP